MARFKYTHKFWSTSDRRPFERSACHRFSKTWTFLHPKKCPRKSENLRGHSEGVWFIFRSIQTASDDKCLPKCTKFHRSIGWHRRRSIAQKSHANVKLSFWFGCRKVCVAFWEIKWIINTDFDRICSPGASDDAASCCVMLEVLRVLSQQKERLRHSVLFLFNGAEETPLQASHGFITQHPWAKNVRGTLSFGSRKKNEEQNVFNNLGRFFPNSIFKFGIGGFEWQRDAVSIGAKSCLVNRCKFREYIFLWERDNRHVIIWVFIDRCINRRWHIPMGKWQPKNYSIPVWYRPTPTSESSEITGMFPAWISLTLWMVIVIIRNTITSITFHRKRCKEPEQIYWNWSE